MELGGEIQALNAAILASDHSSHFVQGRFSDAAQPV